MSSFWIEDKLLRFETTAAVENRVSRPIAEFSTSINFRGEGRSVKCPSAFVEFSQLPTSDILLARSGSASSVI